MQESFKIPSATFPTLTGSIVTFNSQYAGLSLKSHKVALTATQSGSGTPSPVNIRSINGYSELVISNVNTNYFNVDNVYSTFKDGYKVTTTGTSTNTDFYTGNAGASTPVPLAILPQLPFLLAGTYTISCTTTANTELTVFKVDSTGAVTSVGQTSYTGTSKVLTFTLTENTRITIRGRGGITYSNIMLNSGSSALPYTHEGAQITSTIQIGSTVYGGEYDARTGVFTATHYYFKGGFALYNASNGYKAYRKENLPLTVSSGATTQIICNMIGEFGSFNSSNMDRNIITPVSSTNVLYLALDENYSSDDVEVCYKLRTPTTIQLPPCPIETLLGENNIWADTGDTTLQYPKFG